ncbi:MFS transporter [Paenibacillaceae bacterium]|nr:MFS transporter [Paenibacillaceae bacterium]
MLSQPAVANKATARSFPISLISLTVGAFAIGMTEFVIMGILPNVAEDLNVSIPAAGQLITMYALGVAVWAPILTLLTQKIPEKKLLCLLMGLFIIGNIAAVLSPNYAVLMTARLITALTHGTFFGVGAVIASKLVSPDRRAAAISMMMAGLTIANIIGVPLGTYIGQNWGWRASFGTIAVVGVVTLIGIMIFIPQLKQGKVASMSQQIKALTSPRLLTFLTIGVFGNAGLFAIFTYITPLLVNVTGFEEHSVTWILILFGFGVTIGNLIGGRLADWKLMPSILGIYFTICVILVIFNFTMYNPITAVITIFLWGGASFAVFSGMQVRTMSLAKSAPALASTASHSAGNLGNAVGAFVGGMVITHLSLNALPWVGALLVAVALGLGFVCYFWDKRVPEEA